MAWLKGKFTLLAITLQVLFIVLFAIFVEYDHNVDAKYDKSAYRKEYLKKQNYTQEESDLHEYYPFFQDVHVMIFIGFGFLMTFMRKYGFSSIGFTFLIGAFTIQWATLMGGFLHLHDGKILINSQTLLTSDFACATVLITFGAVLGRCSPTQLLILALFETVIFQVNEWVGLKHFKAVDIGGSMFVHVFGAYFGLAVTRVLYYKGEVEEVSHKELPSYDSDIFSMIGTVFLWLFWPSFNSALGIGDDKTRAVLNTYFCLAACCVTTFAMAFVVSKEHRINTEFIQNATLAGGVAVGTVADMQIEPWGAVVIGTAAGILSVLGFKYLTPFLADSLYISDSCGVNNLHGMPGIMAGVAGCIMAARATTDVYGASLYQLFPAMVPKNGTAEWDEFTKKYNLEPGDGRTASEQALYQLAALGMTIGVALVGGLITGVILRIDIWNRPEMDALFEDEEFWEIPFGYPEEHPHGKAEIVHRRPSIFVMEKETSFSNVSDVIKNDNTKI